MLVRFADTYSPDAYTRLILDSVRGKQATFVRSDELLESWRIWTPLLQQLEQNKVEPTKYVYGSHGPEEGEALMAKHGYVSRIEHGLGEIQR